MKKLISIFISILILGCSSDENTMIKKLTSLEITSSNGDLLDIGSSTTLMAMGFDQQNDPIAIMGSPQWSSDNNNVTVDMNGKVTGVAVGKSVVTANVDGITSEYEITVWDSSAPRTEIYVSDAGNFSSSGFKILKFNESGKFPEVFIDKNLAWPQDIVFLENEGTVLISNLNSNSIGRFNASTGDYIDDFATGIDGPTRMKIGEDDLLYVLQWKGDGLVKRYQLDGTFVDDFTSVGVSQSIGLDWDSDGNLYVSSFDGKSVRKFDTSGNDLGLFVSTNLSGPTNIWFDGSGNLYVNDWQGNAVKKFDASGDFVSTFISDVVRPEGVAFLENGNILIGAGNTTNPGTVRMYSSDGTYINNIVEAGTTNLMNTNAVVLRKVN